MSASSIVFHHRLASAFFNVQEWLVTILLSVSCEDMEYNNFLFFSEHIQPEKHVDSYAFFMLAIAFCR